MHLFLCQHVVETKMPRWTWGDLMVHPDCTPARRPWMSLASRISVNMALWRKTAAACAQNFRNKGETINCLLFYIEWVSCFINKMNHVHKFRCLLVCPMPAVWRQSIVKFQFMSSLNNYSFVISHNSTAVFSREKSNEEENDK